MDNAALFLDLDGTLAPIVEQPEDVEPNHLRNRLLAKLNRALNSRLAVVSGRTIEDVDRILDDSIPCVAGIHGLERRNALGHFHTSAPHPDLARVHTLARSFCRIHPDLRVEFKLLAVALHYRQAPELAKKVLAFARRLAWATGLKLQEGRMVVELRSVGADKGDTVRSFMAEAPFEGAIPIFVGDDITDEDGFAAAQALGGVGILVGDWRETNAAARLDGVASVFSWIQSGITTGSLEVQTQR